MFHEFFWEFKEQWTRFIIVRQAGTYKWEISTNLSVIGLKFTGILQSAHPCWKIEINGFFIVLH